MDEGIGIEFNRPDFENFEGQITPLYLAGAPIPTFARIINAVLYNAEYTNHFMFGWSGLKGSSHFAHGASIGSGSQCTIPSNNRHCKKGHQAVRNPPLTTRAGLATCFSFILTRRALLSGAMR